MITNYRGYDIDIKQDTDLENPRGWGNLTTMAFFHKRYNLGDKDHGINSEDYNHWSGMQDDIIKKKKPYCIAPVYMYDHGGITIKIGSFDGLVPQGHAQFDSGCIGFVWVDRAGVDLCMGWKNITKKRVAQLEKQMQGEIKTYDQYLRGDVYGFQINENDLDESCWGFYGEDYCLEEAKIIVDYHIKTKTTTHFEKIKQWIKNRVPFQYRHSLTVM